MNLNKRIKHRADGKKRIAIVINFITSYREGFYRAVLNNSEFEITVFCHTPPIGSSLITIENSFSQNIVIVPAVFFHKESFVWSQLPWKRILFDYDLLFVEGNPRYVSFAALASVAAMLGRNVVLWTMVHSFRNSPVSKWLRLAWTKRFMNLIVYSDREVRELKEVGFKSENIVGINNGLDQERIAATMRDWTPARIESWRREHGLLGRRIILSCARLEEKNKFDQFIDVLPGLVARFPDLTWCLVGDGSQHNALIEKISKKCLTGHVLLAGAIHEEQLLAPWFMTAEFLVHPGAIGLTLFHAFGYGVPVITHANGAHHGPEFVAFDHGRTGLLCEENNSESLELNCKELLTKPAMRRDMSARVREVVELEFNVHVMSQRFLGLARKLSISED